MWYRMDGEHGSYWFLLGLMQLLFWFVLGSVMVPTTALAIPTYLMFSEIGFINNPLSINRAASTRDYITARGVAVSRISIDGRGSREPIASNDTAESRAKNRRVEIFVAEPAPAN